MTENRNFDDLALRLEDKVYTTEKGMIRLTLLKEDLKDFYPILFSKKILTILDAGGGAGRIARFCAGLNHQVLHCDISGEMLKLAESENRKAGLNQRITLRHCAIEDLEGKERGPYDLVCLHGVAEWTGEPLETIRIARELLKPGGVLSLLVYNRDKILLKKGINGQLVSQSRTSAASRRLTPPGGLSVADVRTILNQEPGQVLLQSGIRIFQGFFFTVSASRNR